MNALETFMAASQTALTLTMRTVDTQQPKAVVQQSNNSNYQQPFEGSNCRSDIIEVVENAVFFIALCSIMATGQFIMCVIITIKDKDKIRKHSRLSSTSFC